MNTFLTAYWKNLLFINYEVEAGILQRYLPPGVEPDFYNGKCLVSLVGFMFLNTRVRGIGFPFHRNFEEFNLRFYVRRYEGDSYKRGVVFVKEIVPRRMITYVAKQLYGEKYYYHPMKNTIRETNDELEVSYSFLYKGEWNCIKALADKNKQPLQQGSEEEFITEHYWGYTKLSNGFGSEYEVRHPKWHIYPVKKFDVNVNAKDLYGGAWHESLSSKPVSCFMADGSAVSVLTRTILKEI